MADVLVHRGPDEEGHFADERCALSIRRLAVQDVADGHQPVRNEDRSVVAVLNGEIYNFRELRTDLGRRGHRFGSRSDAEVIPHLYEEHGLDFVRHLDGMFAIALWDKDNRRLALFRDRLGKKPLFYTTVGCLFRFASEIKAFFADRNVPRQPDLAALHHYLVLQYVPGPRTAFVGIHSVGPGERLVVEAGRVRVDRYWALVPRQDDDITPAQAAELTRQGLRDAVHRRMGADVPVGALLSGGVDSACVVATMAELSHDPVHTFTIGFDETERDERELARATARALGTEHSEHVVRADVAGLLPVLAWHCDQPLADDALLPYFVVARQMRQDVTVALSGEGGDEAFAGYPRMREVAGTGLPDSLARTYARSMQTFPEDELRDLYTPRMRAATRHVSTTALLVDEFPDTGDPLTRVLHADYVGRLPGCQLTKVDVTTMAASLEARSPMLDHRFVELSASFPAAVKIGVGGTKLPLRDAFRGIVPDAVLDAPKRGFNLPLRSWFQRELRDVGWSLLTGPTSSTSRFLRREAVCGLLVEHERGDVDHGLRIYSLVCLELWLRTYVDRPPPLSAPAGVRLTDL